MSFSLMSTTVITLALAIGLLIIRNGRADIVSPANYTDCGSVGVFRQLRVTPCPTAPCTIKKGSSVIVEIDFTPKEAVDNITTLVTGLVREKEIHFRGVKPNACEDIVDATNGQSLCPAQDLNKTYTYKTKLNVKASYPTLDLDINWKLLDPKNATIVCFTIAGKVVP